MKLEKLKQKLEKMNLKKRKFNKEYQKKAKAKRKTSDTKIIGITGSRGKSTTALIIHNYLKSLGYRSVLYSSVMVDSPASILKKNEAYEVALRDEKELLSIIDEVEAYDADYLVLEINESTIAKGFLRDVPFDVRVLTNLSPKHNLDQYTEKEYVELKKMFFKDITHECKCVLGFQDYEKELLEEFLQLNDYPKYISTSNYVANVKGVSKDKITCLLTGLETDIDGMQLEFNLRGKNYTLDTNVMMSYNAFNILTAITTLDVLNVLSISKFEKELNKLNIPGRAEVYKANGRLVVIDAHLPAMLESLKKLKDEGKISRIKVVIGSMGHGYKYWEDRFKTEKFALQRKQARKYAMELLNNVADYVYITESDSGKESALAICEELGSYLNDETPFTIVVDRENAIKKAITESKPGDVIFISGRGNRRVLCNSETTMKLIKDSDVVQAVLNKLGW